MARQVRCGILPPITPALTQKEDFMVRVPVSEFTEGKARIA
jgi:hypothetical protein